MRQKESTADWGIVGHGWAVDFLRRGLLNGRIRHAYLITGSPALGKMALARAFAMALNCEAAVAAERPCRQCRACRTIAGGSSPDFILAQREDGAPLKIDAVRNVIRLLTLKPYVGPYRVAVFDDFDMVMPQAQDALLKTLEEPAAHALLILLARSAEGVLPTIRSRAQHIPLRPLPLQLVQEALVGRGCAAGRADLIARLSSGRVGWALAALEDEAVLEFRQETLDGLRDVLAGGRLERLKIAEGMNRRVGRDKARLREILEIWQAYWRDVLLQSCGSSAELSSSDRRDEIQRLAGGLAVGDALRALEATRRSLQMLSTNANVRLALEVLFLEYPGLD